MWLPAVALCTFVAFTGGTFITTGQEDVCDEDPRLLAELRRRTNHDHLIKAFKVRKIPQSWFPKNRGPANTEKNEPNRNKANEKNNQASDKANKNANNKAFNKTNRPTPMTRLLRTHTQPTNFRRDLWGVSRDAWFPKVPMDRVLRHKMIDMVAQAIYGAQYRLKELEPIVNKFTERLEVFTYLIYYEDVLAKHIDVTYLCERLAFLHGSNEGKLMKNSADNKQEHRSTFPENITEQYTGAMELEDVIRAELERERQHKLKQEQERNRQQINRPQPPPQ